MGILLGLYFIRPTTAQARQSNSTNETLIVDSIKIEDNAIIKPAEPPIPVKKVVKATNNEANGDIQISMKAKVIAKWGEDQWPAMKYILDHESGGNPQAINKSSGACGLPQALPCSKLLNVIGSLDNVDGQLDWMVNYIAQRYSTPTNAETFHQSHGWY